MEAVFHLASPASPTDFDRIPEEIMWVNALGTRNLCDLAQRDGARLLLASTSEIYGDPSGAPPARVVLWQREPDRSALALRREQALRRVAGDDAAPDARAECARGADFQYLRPAHARGGRPHVDRVRHQRPPRRTADGGGRRQPDAQPLLRDRYGRGHFPRDVSARHGRPGLQPGQPQRALGGGIRRADPGYRRLVVRDPPRAGPAGRSAAAASRTSGGRSEVLDWQPQISPADGLRQTVDWYREHLALAEPN